MKSFLFIFCQLLLTLLSANNLNQVLIGTHITNDALSLKYFLKSLQSLKKDNFCPSYYFICDDLKKDSNQLIKSFISDHPGKCFLIPSKDILITKRDDTPYDWPLIDMIARIKNYLIKITVDKDFDYLFLVDSNIAFPSQVIDHLLSKRSDLIGNIVWSTSRTEIQNSPHAWICDDGIRHDLAIKKNFHETRQEIEKFINRLKSSGVYEVGGIGEMVLISKKALKEGLNFSLIKNLSFWKAETHFSLRASALNIPILVDTTYPSYQITNQNLELLKKHSIIQ